MKIKQYFLSSTTPNGQRLKWRMNIFPNGCGIKDYIALCLYLIHPSNEEVKAKYQFSIRKSDGDEFQLNPSILNFLL